MTVFKMPEEDNSDPVECSMSLKYLHHLVTWCKQQGVEEERERCAKVCTDWSDEHIKDTGECSYGDCDMVAVATDLAEKIRSGT